MSKLWINDYYQEVERAINFGKSTNELSIRSSFLLLLNKYARKLDYEVVPELSIMGTRGKKVTPDGAVKNRWSLDIGLWESKDEKDDLAQEISEKIKKGYPLVNTLFEDSNTAVLYQYGSEVFSADIHNPESLHVLLTKFFLFKNAVVEKFESAIISFKHDIPIIAETLREVIIVHRSENKSFAVAQADFLALCKVEINPDITIEDVREMMIQHILTCDIFNKIFDDNEFHRHNTIAAALEILIGTLFTYSERRNLLGSIENYYDAINATAAGIPEHHEKQKFLKVLYENFYQAYNPKAADRLGVVYTPNEVVQFMVQSTNHLLHKHFDRTLTEQGVDILDPATGTGTFICEIIENAIAKQDLEYKFQHEIHANEVSILPFYIANLNIEYIYKQRMKKYADFPGLCFVDTLDNTDALYFSGKQHKLFGLSSVNTERIKNQNSREISVIIGNPPYNANQKNENENNKNREYDEIDGRIKETYVKASTAQKTKVYDMYARFYRWATDRIDKDGIIAFVTNRSFIDSRTFDGFRKCISTEFDNAYIIDLGGDIRDTSETSKANVFGIMTGVAIMLLVKKRSEETNKKCVIKYFKLDHQKAEDKLDWLRYTKLQDIRFEDIRPSITHEWVNLANDNDWATLLMLASKDVKSGEKKEAVFKLFSLGVVTNRDEWVYDEKSKDLSTKVKYLIDIYNADRKKYNGMSKKEIAENVNYSIKWTRAVKADLCKGITYKFDKTKITETLYRPFTKRKLYYSSQLNEMQYQIPAIFGKQGERTNKTIIFTDANSQKPFTACCSSIISDLHFVGAACGSECLPLYRYNKYGERQDNITDWGLKQFRDHYQNKEITREDIFHYTYAVLHNPAYREKYEINLKREFPRLPFYEDFAQWAAWGKALMDLHIDYETAASYPLKRHDRDRMHNLKLKVKLKVDHAEGVIEIDELTTLRGIPREVWKYRLGNRTALEWVLDQYKEKKPKDPTIAEKFDTYRFADYKENVIELLKKVCTVSVKTMEIVEKMKLSGKE